MSSAAVARVEDVDYSDARVREQTFRTWPLTRPGITAMAEAGFIYKGSGDSVECYACGVVLSGWSEGDRAKQRHQREAPDCPLTELFRDDDDDDIASHASGATGVSGDSGVGSVYPASAVTVDGSRTLRTGERNPSDVATTVNLMNPKALYADPIPQSARYKKLEERMKSFEGVNWPRDLEAQPDQLAKAGFFYQGPGDKVKCGYCGGKIKNWTATQHAIEEHIRHFPKCTFVANIEKQTKVLSENIRAKSKTAKYAAADELRREYAQKQARTKISKGSELRRKTLSRMGYTDSCIRQAERSVKHKRQQLSLESVLEELQLIEKEQCFDSAPAPQPHAAAAADDDWLSDNDDDDDDDDDLVPVAAEDERVRKMKHELKSAKGERDELSRMMTCKICLSNQANTLFLTCRHFCTCRECADRVKDCPVCREVILGTVDVWMG